MTPGYAPPAPYYRPRVPPASRPSRPWQLVVGAILSMVSGIALLMLLTIGGVQSRSVVYVLLAYIPASALVLAPVFMLMGYRWAYSLTVSGLAGLVISGVLFLVGSELVLLPIFVLVAVILAFVAAPVWLALWLLLTRRVEEVFEGRRKRQLSVYYRTGEDEPPMQDPKETLPYTVMYVPIMPPYYGYPGLGGYYQGYTGQVPAPYHPGYAAYPTGEYGSYDYGPYGPQTPA